MDFVGRLLMKLSDYEIVKTKNGFDIREKNTCWGSIIFLFWYIVIGCILYLIFEVTFNFVENIVRTIDYGLLIIGHYGMFFVDIAVIISLIRLVIEFRDWTNTSFFEYIFEIKLVRLILTFIAFDLVHHGYIDWLQLSPFGLYIPLFWNLFWSFTTLAAYILFIIGIFLTVVFIIRFIFKLFF